MKKQLISDIIRISLFYVALVILFLIVGDFMPSLLILLVGYLISLGILYFFDYTLAKKRESFEKQYANYEKILPSSTWTQVYLKPTTPEQLGIFYYGDNAKEKFYARLFVDTSSTTLGIPNLFINIAILQQEEEITESTEISAKYEIEAFEEHFCLENPN